MKIEGTHPIARYLRCFLDDVEVTNNTLCADDEAGEVELLVRDESGRVRRGADGWAMTEIRKGKVEIMLRDDALANPVVCMAFEDFRKYPDAILKFID